MNTGFSWVRIDKGTIQCTFRRLSLEQVESVINYLRSYFEYQSITYSFVDLGAAGVIKETGDHYRPSPNDSNEDYYWMVELHRHGTIIPQGCVEIIKSALNALATHAIIPQSVYIKRPGSNVLTVEDTGTLELITVNPNAYTSSIEWESSDPTVIDLTADTGDLTCDYEALAPGEADIIATITVPEEMAKSFKAIPTPSALWVDNVIKYIGETVSYRFYQGKYYPISFEYGDVVTFTKNDYYECTKTGTSYSWDPSSYDGTPVDVYYRDSYSVIVSTYVKITSRDVQKLCLYHYLDLTASSPSSPAIPINWYASVSNVISFDEGIDVGDQVTIVGDHVGSTNIFAKVTDPYGVHTDSLPMSIYALAVTPKSIKLVTGATRSLVVHKSDIFMTEYQGPDDPSPVPTPVNWVTASELVATVTSLPTPTDPVLDHAEATVTGQGVGKTYITVMAEDRSDGVGVTYSDVVEVSVGNVAINAVESAIIPLFPAGSETLTLTAEVTSGFSIANDGWVSANPDVVEVTTISGTGNVNCLITGKAVGSAFITVTNQAATDTDRILIKVTDANYATSGEMKTFTHGQFNGHGVVDWDPENLPEVEVEEDLVDLATQPEVDEFIEDLFDGDDSSETDD